MYATDTTTVAVRLVWIAWPPVASYKEKKDDQKVISFI